VNKYTVGTTHFGSVVRQRRHRRRVSETTDSPGVSVSRRRGWSRTLSQPTHTNRLLSCVDSQARRPTDCVATTLSVKNVLRGDGGPTKHRTEENAISWLSKQVYVGGSTGKTHDRFNGAYRRVDGVEIPPTRQSVSVIHKSRPESRATGRRDDWLQSRGRQRRPRTNPRERRHAPENGHQ